MNKNAPFEGLQRGYWAAIVADPGTQFKTRSAAGIGTRSPETKYTTMSDAEIAAMPITELAARNSFLFYWDTSPRVAVGKHIPIMRAWGFEPTAIAFTWVKTRKHENAALFLSERDSFHFGAGYTTRKNTELCILGRRGNPKRRSAKVRELLISPRREHSQKPDEMYDRVREFCDGPYLELFSRTIRPGWECWGDQLGRFAVAA